MVSKSFYSVDNLLFGKGGISMSASRYLKKALLPLVAAGTITAASSDVGAEQFRADRIETAAERAMGGAGAALERQTPARAALEDYELSMDILQVDARGTLSEALRIPGILDQGFGIYETFSEDGMIYDIETLQSIVDIINGLEMDLDANARVRFMESRFGNERIGMFTVGVYGEAEAGLRLRGPRGLSEDSIVVGNIDFDGFDLSDVVDKDQAYIELGEPVDLIEAIARADVGASLGYGRAFRLNYETRLGVGLRARLFHRTSIPHSTATLARRVRGSDDVDVSEIGLMQGYGFAFDLFTIMEFDTDALAGAFAFNVENMGHGWYGDDGDMPEMPRIVVGAVVYPVHCLGNDDWGIALDLEHLTEGRGPTLQMGTFYVLGNERYNFVPRIGGEINGHDAFGEDGHNLLTAGFTSWIRAFGIDAAFEYEPETGNYSVVAGMRVGFDR
jgi:hypothetical protein